MSKAEEYVIALGLGPDRASDHRVPMQWVKWLQRTFDSFESESTPFGRWRGKSAQCALDMVISAANGPLRAGDELIVRWSPLPFHLVR